MTETDGEVGALRKVVLVDDNELTLDGYATTLRQSPGIDLVAAFGHRNALAMRAEWREVDVVVVDAADEGQRGDQYPGVRVVRHIRAHQGTCPPVIIIVTGHFFDDGLRHRMADADADFFFLRPEIRSAERLIEVVLHPERYRRGVPPVSAGEREVLGVHEWSRLEDFVEYVEGHDLESTLDPDAAIPSSGGRRSLMRHRRELARTARIAPRNLTTGTPPLGGQQDPSIRQLRRLWHWAARVKFPDDSGTLE